MSTVVNGRLVVLVACCSAALTHLAASELVWLDSKRIDLLTENTGRKPHDAWVARNEAGTSLFLSLPANGGSLIVVVSEHGILTNWVAGGNPVPMEDGSCLCFLARTNRSLVFSHAPALPLTPASRFGFSPGRGYFFLFEGSSRASIFQTREPRSPAFVLPSGFAPQCIFQSTDTIYVFGTQLRKAAKHQDAWGTVWSKQKGQFHLEREIDLSRFGTVLDMDTVANVLLVDSRSELPRDCGLYGLDTGSYQPVGRCLGHGLFLDPKFRKYLEDLWRTKASAK